MISESFKFKASLALIIALLSFSQNSAFSQKTDETEKKQIEIIHTDSVIVDEEIRPGIQLLIGDVILKHDSALMFCDSAFYNSGQQNFEAFGNIHVQSPTEDLQDTVHLWGDSLKYVGMEKIAKVRTNVILQKDSMFLYTDNLDYNIADDIGNYFDGGRTLSGQDTLVSRLGYYYANENEIYFKDSVKVFNPEYTMFSDTLKHHTKKKISYILSPTSIISTDTTGSFLYCENGWYDHNRDIAQVSQNTLISHLSSTLKGDSLFYDRNKKIGQVFNNVEAKDTTQSAVLMGNYGEYHELTQRTLMTDSAVFIQMQKTDSVFLHADTILSTKDSVLTKEDTTHFTLIRAYYKVKIFKSDFQAKCDSLIYSTLDSTFELRKKPVLWSDKSQITANYIQVQTENNDIKKVNMFTNSLIVMQSDTIRFDQIKGKNMIAYMDSNKLTKVEVKSDSEAIWFGKEGEKLMGVNKIKSVDMTIFMKNNEPDHIKFYKKPEGTLYPPNHLDEEELKLDIFQWNAHHRPKTKDDIFTWLVDLNTSNTGKRVKNLNEVEEEEEKKSKEKGK